MAEPDFISVRYVVGSHDGEVGRLPVVFAYEGYMQSIPSRHRYATSDELLTGAVEPDEQYILHETDDGWVFAHVP